MSIQSAARAAIKQWGNTETALIMLAIAGAESSYNPTIAGDRLGNPFNCNGYESFGLWQIHMPDHADLLVSLGAPSDPCAMADWLKDPDNNAKAAAAILRRQGYTAWSTYKNGTYGHFLDAARQAIQSESKGPQPTSFLAALIGTALIFGVRPPHA